MPPQRHSLLTVRLALAWRWLTAAWRRPSTLQALGLSGQLDAAIRDGDADAVVRLLKAGAPLYSCTLDDEGYHTPLELAGRYANPAVVGVLERAHVRRAG
jgi:hypothetical protein